MRRKVTLSAKFVCRHRLRWMIDTRLRDTTMRLWHEVCALSARLPPVCLFKNCSPRSFPFLCSFTNVSPYCSHSHLESLGAHTHWRHITRADIWRHGTLLAGARVCVYRSDIGLTRADQRLTVRRTPLSHQDYFVFTLIMWRHGYTARPTTARRRQPRAAEYGRVRPKARRRRAWRAVLPVRRDQSPVVSYSRSRQSLARDRPNADARRAARITVRSDFRVAVLGGTYAT